MVGKIRFGPFAHNYKSDFEQWSNRLQLDLILICFPRDEMSDFEQCSNRLRLELFSLLVNFCYTLGKIMTRYTRFVTFSHI